MPPTRTGMWILNRFGHGDAVVDAVVLAFEVSSWLCPHLTGYSEGLVELSDPCARAREWVAVRLILDFLPTSADAEV